MKMKTMIFRACRWPIFFLLICFALLAFMFFLKPSAEVSEVLAGVIRGIFPILKYAFLASFALSVVTGVVALYRLWKWDQGKIEPVCRYCSGLMNYISDGRYGAYYKCLACNQNQKA